MYRVAHHVYELPEIGDDAIEGQNVRVSKTRPHNHLALETLRRVGDTPERLVHFSSTHLLCLGISGLDVSERLESHLWDEVLCY